MSNKELKATFKTSVEIPVIQLDDVKKHNKKDDLWIVIHGSVYDVTAYSQDHPGGAAVFHEVMGKDATGEYEDVGHSEDASEILHSFIVAKLPDTETETVEKPVVKVVRRSPVRHEKKQHLVHPAVELSLFAVAASTGIWFVQHNTSHSSLTKTLSNLRIPSSSASLAQGFAIASAAAATAAFATYRYLQPNFHVDFQSYPAHKNQTTHSIVSTGHPSRALSPQHYRKFTLRSKKELSKGVWRFVFDLPKDSSVLGLPTGQHVSLRAEIDEHTVSRSYTPLSNNSDFGRMELLVRVYPDGLFGSKYLEKLECGDAVDVRGPKGAFKYGKGIRGVKKLGMIAGGTGITPIFQVVRAICENPLDKTEMSLVFANRSENDIMLKKQLDEYAAASEGRFKIHYLVDQPTPSWTGGIGHIDQNILRERLPGPAKDTKVLLCGPPGLVNASLKNLAALGFEEPGEGPSKMSDMLFCF